MSIISSLLVPIFKVFVPPMSTSTSTAGEGQDPERQLRGLGALAAFSDQANEFRRTLRKRQLEFFDGVQEEQEVEEEEDPLAKVIQDNLWTTKSLDGTFLRSKHEAAERGRDLEGLAFQHPEQIRF